MSRFNSDQLIGPSTQEGWAALDLTHMDELDEAKRQQVLDVCRQFQSVFSDEQGRFVLEYLVRTYLIEPRVAQPGDDKLAVGIRQGHQDVVRQILHFIEIARTGGV